jgi:signal transduction histidine kinase
MEMSRRRAYLLSGDQASLQAGLRAEVRGRHGRPADRRPAQPVPDGVGPPGPRPRPLNLATVVEGSSPFRAMAAKHTLRTKLPANLPVVWGDPDQVEQILTNLVGNAIKYSPGAARSSSPWTWMATRCS